MGCEFVKLFPGNIYGPDFIKSVKAPQPWSSIMPTGGVSIEQSNLLGWFKAGADCVGLGSKLISKEILINQDFKKNWPMMNNVEKECLQNALNK